VLNNRHWALLLWLAVFSIWVMTKPDIRRSIGQVARSLFARKLLPIWVGYLGWVLLLILGARRIGWWDSSLLPDTFIWLFVAGWGLFGSFAKANSEPEFFRTHLAQIIGISLLVEFAVDFAVLPLIWELVLIPLVVVLTGVEIVARRNEEGALVSRFASGCLVFIGLALLAAGIVSVVFNWDSLEVSDLLRQVALPIWLSVLVLPYVYLIGIYAAYETVFTLLDIRHRPGWWRRQVTRLALVATFWTRVYDLGQLGRRCYFDLAHAQSWGEARAVIKGQLEDDAYQLRVDEAKRELAERHSGKEGTDAEGGRLDRREFEETQDALRFLHTCHGGWWRKQERYHSDLLALIGGPDGMYGLDSTNGYNEWVSPDGGSWYAWRETISGWIFGIGSNAPPPDEWKYDGPDPPTGPPGADPRWRHDPFGLEAGPNWS
jgi:hypothetical protein